jgi:Fic family protein
LPFRLPRATARSLTAYVPDLLADQTPLTLPGPTVERVAEATAALTAASRSAGAVDLDSLTSLALRSEAIASSVIEGIQVSARNVALADFTGRGSTAALEVARNAPDAPRNAGDGHVRPRHDAGRHHPAVAARPPPTRPATGAGMARRTQPMGAAYVPPTHARVPALMTDLLSYLNEPQDTAIVAAAAVHGQFDTIHPFRDGNGRIGRALTHTLLARALGSPTIIPFSRVFAVRKEDYIDGLVAWRTHDTQEHADDRLHWIEVFADAVIEAAILAERMAHRLATLKREQHELVSEARRQAGGKQPRRGSTVLRLLDDIAAHPIDTAVTAARRLAVSTVAAREALDELTSAGTTGRPR